MSAPAPELRPYQRSVIDRFNAEVEAGRRRVLLVAPTGSGKTVIAGSIIAEAASAGRPVLFLAHRRELIQQTSQKLYAVGVDHGIVQAGVRTRPGEHVQVASIPTLHSRAVRSSSMEMPPANLVVVDEAHHVPARSYRQVLEAYPQATILGLTATPCRSDGRGLGDVFDVLIECPSIDELISAGFLVPTKVYAPSKPDLRGVRVQRGDYVETQLAERMDKPKLVGDVVYNWLKLANARPTVVFATSVAHSIHLRDEFRRAGIWAEHIDGSTPVEERDAILSKLGAGTLQVVTNFGVLTEGWDAPKVSCVVLARPTKHMGLYRQMVGRVLRVADGKTDALVLDHAGAVFEHGYVEDPVIWTLDKKGRPVNPRQTSRARGVLPALTTCPECDAVRSQGRPCPACGWRPQPKPGVVDVADGELSYVDRQGRVQHHVPTPAEKVSFHQQLRWIQLDRGYRPGWTAHKFKEKFGHWPEYGEVEPIPPDPTTSSWVRSRQIAYAKGKGNAKAPRR